MNEEQRITVCKTSLNQIYAMLRTSPQSWRNYIQLARLVITHIDATTFMQQSSRTTEQVWMIAGLQQLAYMDADSGAVTDIASWCSRQWLAISQRDPQNIAALRGIGQSWLSRAQPVLARIHSAEGSSSSSGGSSQQSAPSCSTNGGGRRSANSRTEAERRTDTQDYVEARQYLQPATEYLERAVTAATAQRALSGDLLATVRPYSNLYRPKSTFTLRFNARLRKRTCGSVIHRAHALTNSTLDELWNYCGLLLRSRITR